MEVNKFVELIHWRCKCAIVSFVSLKGVCWNRTRQCQCLKGFTGLFCELDIDECQESDEICFGYQCENLPGDFQCQCDRFHQGKQCQTSKSFILISATFLQEIVFHSVSCFARILFIFLSILLVFSPILLLLYYINRSKFVQRRDVYSISPRFGHSSRQDTVSHESFSKLTIEIRAGMSLFSSDHRIYLPKSSESSLVWCDLLSRSTPRIFIWWE